MAKKASKKPVKKPARPAPKAARLVISRRKSSPPAKKPAFKKAAPRKAAAKKAAPRKAAAPTGPVPINTGAGASPAEIGARFVQLFNARTPDTAIWDELFSNDIVSIEGHGANLSFHGRDMVESKAKQWIEQNIIHGASCEGPYCGATGFAVKIRVDKEDKTTGQRATLEEIGVYSIRDGKIVREEFMYGSM